MDRSSRGIRSMKKIECSCTAAPSWGCMFCIEPAQVPWNNPVHWPKYFQVNESGPSGTGGASYPPDVTGHPAANTCSSAAGHDCDISCVTDAVPLAFERILTTLVVTMELRSRGPAGQRRGRWSGVPLADRQALRRSELIAAGTALLGGPEGPSLTVRAVCRATALTERYFYESFSDRDEFVRAVYDEVCTTAM